VYATNGHGSVHPRLREHKERNHVDGGSASIKG